MEKSQGPMDLKLLNLRFSGPASHLGFRKRNDPSEPPCFFGPVLLERLSGGAVPPAALGSGTRSMHSGKRWTVQKGQLYNNESALAFLPRINLHGSQNMSPRFVSLRFQVAAVMAVMAQEPWSEGSKRFFKTTHICQDWGDGEKN